MREIHSDEMRKIQLDILDYVMKFCDDNNISCWLNGGTLLGAVRHKGYIPWDDDIDLGMLRPDYDKFMKIFNEQADKRYRFHCFENDPELLRPFGKVYDENTIFYEVSENGVKLSVNIDIFAMDNAPDDDKAAYGMLRKRNIYVLLNLARRMPVFLKPTRGNFLRSLCVYAFRLITRIFPRDYFTRKLIENAKSCISQVTKRIGDFSGLHSTMLDKSAFDELKTLEFEGRKYKVPGDYDGWLRGLFGDYMTLPPEEKRVSTHKFKAYIK